MNHDETAKKLLKIAKLITKSAGKKSVFKNDKELTKLYTESNNYFCDVEDDNSLDKLSDIPTVQFPKFKSDVDSISDVVTDAVWVGIEAKGQPVYIINDQEVMNLFIGDINKAKLKIRKLLDQSKKKYGNPFAEGK